MTAEELVKQAYEQMVAAQGFRPDGIYSWECQSETCRDQWRKMIAGVVAETEARVREECAKELQLREQEVQLLQEQTKEYAELKALKLRVEHSSENMVAWRNGYKAGREVTLAQPADESPVPERQTIEPINPTGAAAEELTPERGYLTGEEIEEIARVKRYRRQNEISLLSLEELARRIEASNLPEMVKEHVRIAMALALVAKHDISGVLDEKFGKTMPDPQPDVTIGGNS
jgi:hypothetical protein